ncbi:MAG TPA: ATP-binding protein [Polyangia bacterium]|jgi:hypothetical protein|nr:ATP-binding protein [Polyangia bacterium]
MPEFGPYESVEEYLQDELRRVHLHIEYEVRRRWEFGALPEGEDAGRGVWTRDTIGGLFRASHAAHHGSATPTPGGDAERIGAMLHHHEALINGRTAATYAAGLTLPFIELCERFDLSGSQRLTLLFALMTELDPDVLVHYRCLSNDPGCRGLDARLLAMLVYKNPGDRTRLSYDLAPTSPLVRLGLIEMDEDGWTGGSGHGSWLLRRLRPAPRLVQLLGHGAESHTGLDPQLAEFAELREGAAWGLFPEGLVGRVATALGHPGMLVTVQGVRGVGRRLLLQMAAAERKRRLLLIYGATLAALPPAAVRPIVRGLVREALLLDAVPVVPDVDELGGPQGESAVPPFVRLLAAEHPGAMAITAGRERMPRLDFRPLVQVSLEVPPLRGRVALWQKEVANLQLSDAETLASRFAAAGGVIARAARAALAEQGPEAGPPALEVLDLAVRSQLHDRISRLGRRLDTPYTFADLIVDEDTLSALDEIVGCMLERGTVRERWGFRGAAGVSVLFSGDPGVGKTMSATVIAQRLGLAVYEIDLSRVVSKWLGETEKNLGEVFDAAEPGHVVLLFNEADSLFGKRTSEVKSANDRYANMETNYLLQRLERFGGLAILTTNLGKALDPAFRRRFAYDVQFSFPTPEMRAELWRRTIPPKAAAAGLDFEELARRFELSGGFIKVAAERAAFSAASHGDPITMKHLIVTIERMYRERGKLTAGGKLE